MTHRRLELGVSPDPLGRLLTLAGRHIGHLPIRVRGTFGGSLAYADPAAEWCLLATVLGARIGIASARGHRFVEAGDFFRTPLGAPLAPDDFFGTASSFATALEPDELIDEVRLPLLGPGGSVGFAEFSRRENDSAFVSAAAAIEIDEGEVKRAFVGVGGRGTGPVRAREAEAALVGSPRAASRRGRCRPGRRGDRPARVRHPWLGRVSARARRDARTALDRAGRPSGRDGGAVKHDLVLSVNGRRYELSVEPRKTLADALREDCGLPGTHVGCEHGMCGACTVVLDSEPVRACLMFAVQCAGAEIVTVEGLEGPAGLHPVQAAFKRHHGLQCGFCTPGFLTLSAAVLEQDPEISDEELMRALASNICRCTGYQNIIAAVRDAAREARLGAVTRAGEA